MVKEHWNDEYSVPWRSITRWEAALVAEDGAILSLIMMFQFNQQRTAWEMVIVVNYCPKWQLQ